MEKKFINNLSEELQMKIEPYMNVFGSLAQEMIVEFFDAKETIISFSEPIKKLRFMIEGRAKITFIHADGKQSITHFVKKGEYLGELKFLEIEKEHKNVNAISKCIFLSVDMELAKSTLKEESKFLFKLNQLIGKKMLDRTYFYSKNQNYELRNRLAAYILLAQNEGRYNEKHTETAEYLGVSYRHLLHTFKEFLDEGLLIKLKKGYELDLEALQELSLDINLNIFL